MFDIRIIYKFQILNFSDKLCGSVENRNMIKLVPKILGVFITNKEGLEILEVMKGITGSAERTHAGEEWRRGIIVDTTINRNYWYAEIV